MNCEQKSNIFGSPNTGVHIVRIPIIDLALFDVLLTFFLAFVIFWIFVYIFRNFFSIEIENNTVYYIILFLTFIGGILIHNWFCIKSTINQFVAKIF